MNKKVYIVDDDQSVISALKNLLSSEDYLIEAFTSPAEFMNLQSYSLPSCLIVDLNMPGFNGFEVASALNERGYSIPTIFLTGHGTIPVSVKAMKAGAFEFLTKPVLPDDLMNSVSDALSVSEKNAVQSQEKQTLTTRMRSLTPREKELMHLIIRGLLNKQIASEMEISEITAKVHKRRVLDKMKVRSVPELIRAAEKLGILHEN